MSKGQILRALVAERLSAAAEDIFALFERTIVEYEEELCRSIEENRRKQQFLEEVLSPRVELVRVNFQIPSTSPGPGPGLNQEITETPQIKEEQSVKQEEEQLPVFVPESSAVCVKTKESSELPQRQTEHQEETQRGNISSEPYFHSETEGHTEHSTDTVNDDDWDPPFGCSAAQLETDSDRGHYNQVQISDRSAELFPQNTSAPENTVLSHMSGANERAERKRHLCHVCNKRFLTNFLLQVHIRSHTKEKPYSCSICDKSFSMKSNLVRHNRTHTGERPYNCTVCMKSFTEKYALTLHRKIHTGERPFRCSICDKTFIYKYKLAQHKKLHTGEKPFNCSVCKKSFSSKYSLKDHNGTHTGEKPFSCPFCDKRFVKKYSLNEHVRNHTGEKTYECPICTKSFASRCVLKNHRTTTHKGKKISISKNTRAPTEDGVADVAGHAL